MIIPDVNILVYAYDESSPYFTECRAWWEDTVNSGAEIGLPTAVILGFIRITTHPKISATPASMSTALSVVQTWLSVPTIVVIEPTAQHWRILSEILRKLPHGGKLVTDAHLAALSREYRATIATNDRDFDRFAGISSFNPVRT